MESLQGCLLVASKSLRDPNFLRTVVLLVDHTEEGAMGIVLNRPSRMTMKEAWTKFRNTPCPLDDVLFQGGPCPAPLMAIHTERNLLEIEVLPNVFFSAGQEKLDLLIAHAGAPIRFYVGCAGWAPGQLEAELEEGAWHYTPATPGHIFGQQDDLWDDVRAEITSASYLSMLDIRHVPNDPSMN